MANEITVQRSGTMHGIWDGRPRADVTFKVSNDADKDVYVVKSGRKLVMILEFDRASDKNHVAVQPWFGGMFWVTATTIEDAVSEGMEFFQCFITGDGQFRKD